MSGWSCQVCQQPAPEGDPVCTKCGETAGQESYTDDTMNRGADML